MALFSLPQTHTAAFASYNIAQSAPESAPKSTQESPAENVEPSGQATEGPTTENAETADSVDFRDKGVVLDPRVRAALNQIRGGAVNQGIKDLLKIANEGVGEAYFHLGEIYNLGIGREPNPDVAIMYYRLAGVLGHGRASLTLANMLYFDIKDDEAITEAAEIYKRYALMDEPEALYMLGMLLWNGDIGDIADPIRGYGLVWRAKDRGYNIAISTEIEMREQLSTDARNTGRLYGLDLEAEGIDDEPLALELLVKDFAPETGIQKDPPEDWDAVWRVEIGRAPSRESAERLQEQINLKLGERIGDLPFIIRLDQTTGERWQVVYGPLNNLQDTINRCIVFKRNGFDCYSKAPR